MTDVALIGRTMINTILCKTIYRWKAKQLFGKAGRGTYCIRPIRVINGREVHVGDRVSILHFLRLEVYRQDEDNKKPVVKIGNDVNIEQNVHITAGKSIEIGDESSILAGAVITDINHPYDDVDVPASRQKIECAPVTIGKQCFIGTHVMIMPGVKLGDHVIVGANSVVTKSFPKNSVIAGSPAKLIKKYDEKNHTWTTC